MPVETIETPLARYTTAVPAEWLDYNGHMNVAYYMLAFDRATDVLFDYVGTGAAHIEAANQSMFALESHVTYRRELRLGDGLRVESRLLGFDDKRMHFFHRMYRADDGELAATCELLGMHIDMERRRSAPFPPAVHERLAAVRQAHAALPPAPEVGRVMALKPVD